MSAFAESVREWRRPPAVVTAVAFVLVSLATGGIVVLPVLPPLDLAVGLAVPLALLFGPAAVLGVAVGVLLTAAFGLATSLGPLLDAVAYAVLAAVACRLWGVLPGVATGEDPTLRSARQWLEFAVVAFLAASTAVAVLAWTTLVVWGGDFHAVVFAELPIVLVSTVVVGPAVLVPATSVRDGRAAARIDARETERIDDREAERIDGRETERVDDREAERVDDPAVALLDDRVAVPFDLPLAAYADRTPIERGSGAFRGAVLGPVLWLVAGSLASLVVALAQQVGGATFRRHGYGTFYAPVDPSIVGPGGRRVQIVFGAALLALVAAAYAPLPWIHSRDRPSTGGARPSSGESSPSSAGSSPASGDDAPPSSAERQSSPSTPTEP